MEHGDQLLLCTKGTKYAVLSEEHKVWLHKKTGPPPPVVEGIHSSV